MPKARAETGVMQLSGMGLTCIRGGREVFRTVSFDLRGAEALIVLGPNGAGKSSLLRMIAGLLRAIDGRLELRGGDPELTIAEQTHYLGHQDALKPSLTVAENLEFWTQYLGGATETARPALQAVGLDE